MSTEQLRLRSFDTGRPASYPNWRLAAKAAIACRADDAALDEYVEAIEDPLVDSA